MSTLFDAATGALLIQDSGNGIQNVTGSSMVKTAPPPGAFAPDTRPPCASTSALTTLSPSPSPRCDRL